MSTITKALSHLPRKAASGGVTVEAACEEMRNKEAGELDRSLLEFSQEALALHKTRSDGNSLKLADLRKAMQNRRSNLVDELKPLRGKLLGTRDLSLFGGIGNAVGTALLATGSLLPGAVFIAAGVGLLGVATCSLVSNSKKSDTLLRENEELKSHLGALRNWETQMAPEQSSSRAASVSVQIWDKNGWNVAP